MGRFKRGFKKFKKWAKKKRLGRKLLGVGGLAAAAFTGGASLGLLKGGKLTGGISKVEMKLKGSNIGGLASKLNGFKNQIDSIGGLNDQTEGLGSVWSGGPPNNNQHSNNVGYSSNNNVQTTKNISTPVKIGIGLGLLKYLT